MSLIPNPPIAASLMTLESEYADDVNFINESLEPLETLLPIATTVFKDWNLHINQDKTEYSFCELREPYV